MTTHLNANNKRQQRGLTAAGVSGQQCGDIPCAGESRT